MKRRKNRSFDVIPLLIEIEKALLNETLERNRQAIIGSRDFLLFSALDLSKPRPPRSVVRVLGYHLENLANCGIDPSGWAAKRPQHKKYPFSIIPVPCIYQEGGAQ
jgi:hypothetical protein